MIRNITPQFLSLRPNNTLDAFHSPSPLQNTEFLLHQELLDDLPYYSSDDASNVASSHTHPILKKRRQRNMQSDDMTHSPSQDDQLQEYLKHWRSLSQDIGPSLTQLHSLHRSHLTHHINKNPQTHLAEKQQIESLTESCRVTLQNMQIFIKRLSTRRDNVIYANLTKKFLSEWMDLASQFQNEQEDYLAKLDALKKRRRELSIVDDADDADLQETEEMMDKLYDKGFSDAQINVIMQNRRDVISRDKELSEIAKSIVSLHELFEHLNTLVLEQGTMLDRIDFNLEQTHTSLVGANRHLTVAERHDRAGRSMICILILIVAVCITGALFLVKILSSLSSFY